MNKETYQKIESKFDLIETVLVVITAVSFGLLAKTVAYSQYGVYVGLTLLAFLYWIMGMKPIDGVETRMRRTSRKIVFLSYAISCLGIMSSCRFDSADASSDALLIVAGCALLIGVVMISVEHFNKKIEKITSLLVRSAVFAILILWFLAMGN